MKRFIKASRTKTKWEIIEEAVLNIENMLDSGQIEDEESIYHEAESQIYFLTSKYFGKSASGNELEDLTEAVLDDLRMSYYID